MALGPLVQVYRDIAIVLISSETSVIGYYKFTLLQNVLLS